jgi:hypothetical protein
MPSVTGIVKQFSCFGKENGKVVPPVARKVKRFACLARKMGSCAFCGKESEAIHLFGEECETVRMIGKQTGKLYLL